MTKHLVGLCLFVLLAARSAAQREISLYDTTAPGSESWNYPEQQDTAMGTAFFYNVSKPTLTVYLPDSASASGTGVIICPGGGFSLVMKGSEGEEMAKWLANQGIAAFVLKYRTLKIDGQQPFQTMFNRLQKKDFTNLIKPVVRMEIADGITALRYLRVNASEFHLDKSHIGIIGFSAGGMIAAGCAMDRVEKNRPNFSASVYGYIIPELTQIIPKGASPMFIAVAADDQLGLAERNLSFFSKLLASQIPAELHMYQKGGHGFALQKNNLTTDTWSAGFIQWLTMNNWFKH